MLPSIPATRSAASGLIGLLPGRRIVTRPRKPQVVQAFAPQGVLRHVVFEDRHLHGIVTDFFDVLQHGQDRVFQRITPQQQIYPNRTTNLPNLVYSSDFIFPWGPQASPGQRTKCPGGRPRAHAIHRKLLPAQSFSRCGRAQINQTSPTRGAVVQRRLKLNFVSSQVNFGRLVVGRPSTPDRANRLGGTLPVFTAGVAAMVVGGGVSFIVPVAGSAARQKILHQKDHAGGKAQGQ